MSFPLLRQLTLLNLSISGGVFHGLLSGCHVLESLFVSEVRAEGCLQVFQGLSPIILANWMRTVKVLAVDSCHSQLNAILSVLGWFPCLEKLYVTVSTWRLQL